LCYLSDEGVIAELRKPADSARPADEIHAHPLDDRCLVGVGVGSGHE
jgi:hypothetical protein